jgi:hypothetical protein
MPAEICTVDIIEKLTLCSRMLTQAQKKMCKKTRDIIENWT